MSRNMPKAPRDLGKYKSSEWLLDKLAISWSFGFGKSCPKCWDLKPGTKKNLVLFLLMFSDVPFHPETVSTNMTYTT